MVVSQRAIPDSTHIFLNLVNSWPAESMAMGKGSEGVCGCKPSRGHEVG